MVFSLLVYTKKKKKKPTHLKKALQYVPTGLPFQSKISHEDNRPIHRAFKINMQATAMTVLHLTRMKDNRCDIKVNTYLA